MTLQEAAATIANRIDGQLGALRAAASNGKPIVLPDGRSVSVQAPHPMDLTVSILQASSVLLQFMNAMGSTLGKGFILSDEEAGRIADLVVARLKQPVAPEGMKP